MDILIEARALAAASGGVKTYTHQLISNLIALYPHEKFEIIYGSSAPVGTFPSVQETVLPLHSEALLPYWMSRTLPAYVKRRKPSIVHYTKAAIPSQNTVPTVVTLYDIIPILMPETQSLLRRIYWPRALQHAAKYSDHIMTISQGSKRDITKKLDVPEEKITVTPLAVDLNHFKPMPASSTLGVNGETPSVFPAGFALRQPYILFVGTRDPRKNISSLIRAFARIADAIPHTLIIAGKSAKKEDMSKQEVTRCKLENRIQFLEDVSYNQLPALYSNADIFVWPSLYEGWGFPPQEAMACGTPVIVSDGTPLPEVVGDAGIVVALGEGFVERLSDEILSLINDEARKTSLRARGLARVQQFSWESVARSTYEVYNKVAV